MAERTAAQTALREILDRMFEGSPVRLVDALFEKEDLSPAEFEALRRRILELRKKEGGSRE